MYVSQPSSEPSHDQILELWVEHGQSFTKRAADLTSAWNANHSEAVTQYASVQSLPSTSLLSSPKTTNFPSRITITRSHSTRSSIRALRQQRRTLLLQYEQQQRQKKLEKERLIAEQRQAAANAAAQAAHKRKVEQEQQRRAQLEEKARREQQERERKAAEQAALEKAAAVKSSAEKAAAEKAAAEKAHAGKKAADAAKIAALPQSNDPAFQKKFKAWQSGPSLDWYDDPSQLPNGEKDPGLDEICFALNTYEKVVELSKPFRSDPSMKRPRIAAKRVITRAINQSSGTMDQARTKIAEILQGFHDLNSLQNPSALAFGMHEFVIQILLESNNSIVGNKDLAYGLAAVIVGVTAGCPDSNTMRNVVLGGLYKQCVFCRPHFPSKKRDEDFASYRARLGYKEDEKDEDFIRRNRSYIHLLAAMFQTNVNILQMQNMLGTTNPFPITLAWTWLARIGNRKQRKLVPEVVYAFLETAGYGMSLAFPSHFGPLMGALHRVVINHASPYASALSISNITNMMEEFEQNGMKFTEAPPGRNLPQRDSRNT